MGYPLNINAQQSDKPMNVRTLQNSTRIGIKVYSARRERPPKRGRTVHLQKVCKTPSASAISGQSLRPHCLCTMAMCGGGKKEMQQRHGSLVDRADASMLSSVDAVQRVYYCPCAIIFATNVSCARALQASCGRTCSDWCWWIQAQARRVRWQGCNGIG